jgi:hypothetical protein
LLLKLCNKNKISLYTDKEKIIIKNKIKKSFLIFYNNLLKAPISFKFKKLLKNKFIQFIKLKIRSFNKINLKEKLCVLKKKFRSYSLINANINLRQFSKNKNKRIFKFILNKLIKKQAVANALLFDQYLNLNLNVLFFKRFKFHFLNDFYQILFNKKKFNFNNFNLYFMSKIYSKIVNFGHLFLYFSKVKNINIFNNMLYNYISKKFSKLFNFEYKFFNQFKKFLVNIRYINYIKISFNIKAFGSINKRNKRKIRKYFKKYKKNNIFLFFNLAFLKLVIFLFLYWFNKIIILLNHEIKGIIMYNWFKPIYFFYKIYYWRKKYRHFYLPYNEMNKFIFLNYKNILLKY